MTPTQSRVLAYYRNYIAEFGYPPSFTEVTQALGYKPTSRSRVHTLVTELVQQGKLRAIGGRGHRRKYHPVGDEYDPHSFRAGVRAALRVAEAESKRVDVEYGIVSQASASMRNCVRDLKKLLIEGYQDGKRSAATGRPGQVSEAPPG